MIAKQARYLLFLSAFALPVQASSFDGAQKSLAQPATVVRQKTEKSLYATLFSRFARCSKRTKIAVGVGLAAVATGIAWWLWKKFGKPKDDPKDGQQDLGEDQPLPQQKRDDDMVKHRTAYRLAEIRSRVPNWFKDRSKVKQD